MLEAGTEQLIAKTKADEREAHDRQLAATSIRTLLLLLLAATLALMAVLLVGSYVVDRHQDLQRAEVSALAMVQLAAADLSGLLADSEHSLRTIAATPQVAVMNPRDCNAVRAIAEATTAERSVIVADANGQIVCSTVTLTGHTPVAAWFRSVIQSGQLSLSPRFTDEATARHVSLMSVPVRRSDGTIAGAVAVPIDLTRYQQQLRSVLAFDSTLTVLDRDGALIARSRERRNGPGGVPIRPEVIASARAAGQGTLMSVGPDGSPRLIAFATVPRFEWMVFEGIPTDLILGPVHGWAQTDAALWLVGLTLIAMLTLYIARRIADPIQDLAAVAQTIGHGPSERRAAVDGPLEIRQVATQFNAMVSRLEDTVASERRLHAEIRALSARVLEVQEEERKRISRDLHDDLGQKLAALRMDLAGSSGQLKEGEVKERLDRMKDVVDSTIDTVRRIAKELRPAMLDDLGLIAVVEREVREFEKRTGIPVNLSVRPARFVVGSEESTAIFRILQETLTNVTRHSGATEVDIRLWRNDGGILLVVRDNGRGMAVEPVGGRVGLGLVGMRERAMMLGGSATIEGAEGEGTVVTVQLPAA